MGKRMLFIFNPRAGKGSIKNRLVDILDIFVKAGYEVTVHPTQAYRDGQRAENMTCWLPAVGTGPWMRS